MPKRGDLAVEIQQAEVAFYTTTCCVWHGLFAIHRELICICGRWIQSTMHIPAQDGSRQIHGTLISDPRWTVVMQRLDVPRSARLMVLT
jgi:hypothetical protein